MPGRKPLATPSDIVYVYDGGLKGFYTCVHECVYSGRLPMAIWPEKGLQPSLLPYHWVETDPEKAARVREAVRRKISPRAQELVETVFLSCLKEKELPSLKFLLMAFQEGSSVINRMQDEDVAALIHAERHLTGEAHLLKGFIRFSDYQGRLIATIKPKNFVLPFLADHFIGRYSEEDFMIYDKTNLAALLYEHRQAQIIPLEEMAEFEASEEELYYRELWKRFYHTIAIKSRENPRCRMTHMPKRYWAEMTEMKELL